MNRLVLAGIAIVVCVSIATVVIWKETGPGKPLSPNGPGPVPLTAQQKTAVLQGIKTHSKAASAARDERNRQTRAAEASALATALASDQQFIKLPPFIENVSLDSKGQAWFQAEATDVDALDAMKLSVVQASAGSTQLLRGRLLLHDSAGRFWMRSPGGQDGLLGYDKGQWIERQALNMSPAELKSKPKYDRGRFIDRGFEDSKGNLYFFVQLTNQGGLALHRRAADGTWSYQVILDASDKKIAAQLLRNTTFVEQANGMITVCGIYGEYDCYVLQFDGSKWQIIDPRICKAKHGTYQVIPLRDGSILTICGNSRLWTYWPPEALKRMDDRAESLAAQLQAEDPRDREEAQQQLARMGPSVLPRLKQAEQTLTVPESKQRVAAIIDTLTKIQNDLAADLHDDSLLYAGRYTYRACYVAARSLAGKTVLYVEDCTDTFTKKTYPGALATVQPDGTWDLAPVDLDQWRATGYQHYPKDAFVDSKGRLWLEDSLRIKPDRTLERITTGFQYYKVDGEDFAGHFYLTSNSNDRYVLNESGAANKSDLPETQFDNLITYPSAGTSGGWALTTTDNATRLLRLNGEKPQPVSTWNDVGVQQVIPLRGENAIVLFFPIETTVNRQNFAALWDGKTWHESGDLPTLVQQNAAVLASCADVDMSDRAMAPLASDGKGNLWFHRQFAIGYENGPNQEEMLQYFDGKNWHDAKADLNKSNVPSIGEVARSADGGKSIVLSLPEENKVVTLSYVSGSFKSTPIAGATMTDAAAFANGILDRTAGDIWLTNPVSLGTGIRRYHDGALTPNTFRDAPVFADTAGNIFFIAPSHQLIVRKGDATGTLSIDGLDSNAKMIQSTDGRIWLLATDALHQIVVTAAGDSIALRDAGHWSWGAPRMQFEKVFCDDAKGLWFSPGGAVAIRVWLP